MTSPARPTALSLAWAAAKRAAPQPQSPSLARYATDPIAWAVERMGIPEATIRWSLNDGYDAHRWDGTPDPLVRVCEALARGDDVGVESATGTGKTFLGAWIVLWFLDCFEGSTVVTAAPKEKQLTLHIWKEIGRLWSRFQAVRPSAELTTLRIRMRPGSDEWAAHGFAVGVGAGEESATKAQGFHAAHMLLITEETPGVPGAVMTAFENTSTAPHNLRLAFGNPDHQLDELHKFCESPGVVAVRISALDHPNVVTDTEVVAGAVSRRSVTRRKQKLGEDSRLYQSRVRGVSPAESADALIRIAWIKAAQERYDDPKFRQGRPALGLDVANSENGDEAAKARGVGACLLEVTAEPCPDANEFARNVAAEMKVGFIRPEEVGVDSVGVGAGTVNEFRRLKLQVVPLSGAGAPRPGADGPQQEKFFNLRAQMHWKMRTDLQEGLIALPTDDEELVNDLITPMWTTRNGKIIIEAKEDIVKRLKRSPNKGDAAVYWNWVRSGRGSGGWSSSPGASDPVGTAAIVGQRF